MPARRGALSCGRTIPAMVRSNRAPLIPLLRRFQIKPGSKQVQISLFKFAGLTLPRLPATGDCHHSTDPAPGRNIFRALGDAFQGQKSTQTLHSLSKNARGPNIVRWQEEYRGRCLSASQALKSVRSGDRVWIQPSCGTPKPLIDALVARAPELIDVELVHMKTLGDA